MERIAYLIKRYLPSLFPVIEFTAAQVTKVRYGRIIRDAAEQSEVRGSIDGSEAVMRSFLASEARLLAEFLSKMDSKHLEYFRPHPFDEKSLEKIIKSDAYLNYGLFYKGQIIAYGLLKASPTGSLYRGRIVSPPFCGKGVGKFVGEYLSWQATLTGLRVRSTVSTKNIASRKSFGASAETKVISELPDGFQLIEFRAEVTKPPLLKIGSSSIRNQ